MGKIKMRDYQSPILKIELLQDDVVRTSGALEDSYTSDPNFQ